LTSIFLSLVFDASFEDYDMSSELLASTKNFQISFKYLKAFVRWDSLFFCEIVQNGYQFDKNHVFFPLYPLILKAFETVQPTFLLSDPMIFMIFAGLIINLILNCLNAILFFR